MIINTVRCVCHVCFCEVEIESQSWGTTEGAKKATKSVDDSCINNVIDNEEVDTSILIDAHVQR